jgi:hypothetical protein
MSWRHARLMERQDVAPTNATVKNQSAPCGQIVDAESCQDRDDEGLVISDMYYGCGCRSIRHEYHDGSICRRILHHDGTVLVDELIAEHMV